MADEMHGRKEIPKTNKKLSIFSFFCFPQMNKKCSTETGMEGET